MVPYRVSASVSPLTLHFLGIGAQKAGTTWLYEQLQEHPGLSFPGGKEVHFWDVHVHRGVDWYRSLFAVPDGKMHGDITPRYAILAPEVIQACHAAFPHLKIIYTLRNPMDRAWSAAKMVLQSKGLSVEQVSPEWFTEEVMRQDSLARGDYESCIRNWRRFYPQECMLILRFEDLVESPRTYLARCLDHLGVDQLPALNSARLREPVNKGLPGDMPAAVRSALMEFYRGKIQSLGDYLNQDMSKWLH